MITDAELENVFLFWLNYYTSRGNKHYDDTPDWKIIELYHDLIVDRVLEGYPEEYDANEIIERLSNMF